MVSRRGFLSSLLGGAAIVAVAPATLLKMFDSPEIIGQYNDYCNFSTMAAVYYDKQAMETLKSNFTFEHLSAQKQIPANMGRRINFVSYPMGC